jgi:predicted phospho-2-dehydro-3-deoxyheptonate aldolase
LENGKAVIIPMDHGVSCGPIDGLIDMNKAVEDMTAGGASAVLLHKGIIKSLKSRPKCGVILHASAGTDLERDTKRKAVVASVEDALRLGANAMSIHVNIGGSEYEPEMLQDLGKMASDCDKANMPLLAMTYARGDNVKNSFDVEAIKLVTRVGAELGADIVKCNYTGDSASFKEVVCGCPVPVVIAGGPKCKTDKDVLEMVRGAMDAGSIGISLGRNAFQHANRIKMVSALRAIIVNNSSVEDAMKLFK